MKLTQHDTHLEIAADADEQSQLQCDRAATPDFFDTNDYMLEMLEDDLANCGLEWIGPEEVGALTSAPMLGERGESEEVVAAYAFMDYQIVSVQDRLADTGSVAFQRG